MKNDLTSLEHLRRTTLEARGLIGAVASTAAEAVEEVAAGLPVKRAVTLTAAGWTGNGPYAQTVAVEGARADEAGQMVRLVPAAAGRSVWDAAGAECTGQGAGVLTFSAVKKPAADIQVFVILQEV